MKQNTDLEKQNAGKIKESKKWQKKTEQEYKKKNSERYYQTGIKQH
jgi:hypothetical protein